MSRCLADGLASRLHRLAIDFVLTAGPSMAEAVVLAEDLVATGNDTPATVTVAALSRDVIRSDAEDQVRQMLAEHDIVVPVVEDSQDEYRMLLRAFAFWDLPAHQFAGAFWMHLSDSDEHTWLDRELASLLHRRDEEGWTMARRAIEERIRVVARTSFATTAPDQQDLAH